MRIPGSTSRLLRRATLSAPLLLLLAAAGAPPVRAQAGAEAAAAAKSAAEWAERRSAGEAAAPSSKTIAQPRPRTAAAAPAPALPARKPSGEPGRLAGRVLERPTQAGVPGVVVSLTSTEPEFAVETHLARTDSAGRYGFPAVEPGRWSLAVPRDRLDPAFAAPSPRVVVVAPRDSLALAPLLLDRAACVRGQAVWADGYVFSSEGKVEVTPADTARPVAEGRLDGVGDYEVCAAGAGPAMVWLVLRDGRRLGVQVRLDPAQPAVAGFRPEPLEAISGTLVHVEARTAAGQAVGKAVVVAVGRKLPVGEEPMMVFAREVVADAGGVADLRLPYGTYEILAMNPREGQHGRVEQFVVARGAPAEVTHTVTVRDASTPAERERWRLQLFERADRFQRWWAL